MIPVRGRDRNQDTDRKLAEPAVEQARSFERKDFSVYKPHAQIAEAQAKSLLTPALIAEEMAAF